MQRSIHRTVTSRHSEVDMEDDVAHQGPLKELSSALDRLWIPGDGLNDFGLAIGMPNNLTELFIVSLDTLYMLKSVLQHCQNLHSLGLMITKDQTVPSLRSILEEAPASLPNLTSFKLIWPIRYNRGSDTTLPVDALVGFLRTKTQLRRLDLPLSQQNGSEWPSGPLLDLLPLLPNVEVLGLQVDNISVASMKALDAKLPLGLTTLLLEYCREEEDRMGAQAFLNAVTKRSRLRYLHVLDKSGEMSALQVHFDAELPKLQLSGYGPRMRWIDKSRYPYHHTTTEWSLEKMTFRSECDFGNEDWEWLLRCRGWGTLDSLSPGTCPDDW
ncbi:hypothetical protein GY45DRAFT_516432 [Cubamyces sp. BRFM 1775]|nr:hypothetical protein GY45DRAFT_516432 [Cubamyces sp. BRFM 1775]